MPDYDDLPAVPDGGRSAWGVFGDTDSVGLINLLTPDVVVHAVGLVRRGAVFALDTPLDFFDPPLFERQRIDRRTIVGYEDRVLNEVINNFNPQSASQWDSLAHVGFKSGTFYNGASLQQVLNDGRNTIDHWARHGIVGRGVMLDLARLARENGEYDPGSSHSFSAKDLEVCRKAAGVEFRAGDIVVLRTGFCGWYAELSDAERRRISSREQMCAPGIEHSEDMARYIWNTHACAFVCDCPSLEVWPMDNRPEAWPFGSMHHMLIGQFGLAIGELWWLDELAADCATDGVYEFLVTSAPLHARGGIGSTANALAVK